jgi:hypothetical protein
MTHTEREWRDGQPEGAGMDESTGPGRPAPAAEHVHEDDPLVERVHEDDPLVEQVRTDDPLVEPAPDDLLAEPAPDDDPLVEEAPEKDALAEPMPTATGSADGGASTSPTPRTSPSGPAENERFVARWQEIQAGFVDEPRRAVQDADALVVDMMDRLARMLASEREQLESLGETGQVSTEDLRQGLRRYRALYERLLAV